MGFSLQHQTVTDRGALAADTACSTAAYRELGADHFTDAPL